MTGIKKLYETLIVGLVWLPVAAIAVFLAHNMEDIKGEDWTVYGVLALLVAIAFVATEFILETVHIDTSYSPD